MPSIWTRGTLAAFIAAGMAGVSANAQSPQPCATTPPHCTQTLTPRPGHSIAPPVQPQPYAPTETPPPWQPPATDPSEVPPPPDPMRPPMDPMQSPMDPAQSPRDPMPLPMDPAQAPLDSPASTDTMADLSFGSGQSGIGSPDVAFNSSPNMMGDLLRAYRSVTFSYLQAGDFGVANTSGAVNFRNSKVAENNNAIPRDRISFRYNYFKEALSVQGLDGSPALTPRIQQAPGTPVRQFNQVQPATQSYSVQLYTLGLEKTFFDALASVEVRVPFAYTLDSTQDLVSGDLLFDIPDEVPLVQPTPGQTLGSTDTELQDMNVIFKAIIAQDLSRGYVVSSGLGVTIPTGEDLNVRVVDYSNDIPGDPGDLVLLTRDPLGNQFAFDQRTRHFRIENETWGLSPFLAAALLPTERTFVNGFVQVEVPLNSSSWQFRERDIDLEVQFNPAFAAQDPVQFDRTLTGEIDDQTLLHLDIGGGYWLYRNPTKKFLSGLAALLELHYTTSLEDADIVVVPETPVRTTQSAFIQTPGGTVPGGNGLIGPLDPPRLGNIANRIDFLNLTMGSHLLVGQNAAISTAYVVPLRDDLDRTFDGEFNLQLNLYR